MSESRDRDGLDDSKDVGDDEYIIDLLFVSGYLRSWLLCLQIKKAQIWKKQKMI